MGAFVHTKRRIKARGWDTNSLEQVAVKEAFSFGRFIQVIGVM